MRCLTGFFFCFFLEIERESLPRVRKNLAHEENTVVKITPRNFVILNHTEIVTEISVQSV